MIAQFRPEYLHALELLGRACVRVQARGISPPVLVGGAVVEYYTGGAYTSGDFDLQTSAEPPFIEELLALGFRHEDRTGRMLKGFYHPDFDLGVELVSGQLFDGRADRSRLHNVRLADDSLIRVASAEDIVADRVGQYLSDPQHRQASLDQARTVYLLLEPQLDNTYLTQRLNDETAGEISLTDFQKLIGHDRG